MWLMNQDKKYEVKTEKVPKNKISEIGTQKSVNAFGLYRKRRYREIDYVTKTSYGI